MLIICTFCRIPLYFYFCIKLFEESPKLGMSNVLLIWSRGTVRKAWHRSYTNSIYVKSLNETVFQIPCNGTLEKTSYCESSACSLLEIWNAYVSLCDSHALCRMLNLSEQIYHLWKFEGFSIVAFVNFFPNLVFHLINFCSWRWHSL